MLAAIKADSASCGAVCRSLSGAGSWAGSVDGAGEGSVVDSGSVAGDVSGSAGFDATGGSTSTISSGPWSFSLAILPCSSGPDPSTTILPSFMLMPTKPGRSRKEAATSAARLPCSPAAANCSGVIPRSRRIASCRPSALIPADSCSGEAPKEDAAVPEPPEMASVSAAAGMAPSVAPKTKAVAAPRARIPRKLFLTRL